MRMMGRTSKVAACLALAALLSVPLLPAGSGCGGGYSFALRPLQEPAGFALYRPPAATAKASLPPRALPSSLSGVAGAEAASLSREESALLLENGFAVTIPGTDALSGIYRDASAPPFVTLDVLLYAFQRLCRRAELEMARGGLRSDLEGLTGALLQRASFFVEEAGGKVGEAARFLQAYFGVAARLLDPACEIPSGVEEQVEREVRLVEGAAGTAESPLFGYEMDYRDFAPYGAYASGPEAEGFFRALTWYGEAVMRLRPGEGEGMAELGRKETRQAALAVAVLHTAEMGGEDALQAWERLYQVNRFFLSGTGGLSVYDYTRAMREVFGERVSLKSLERDRDIDALAERLKETAAAAGWPAAAGPDGGREREGLRLLGERSWPDQSVWEELTDPAVRGRGMPSGLDLPAALGSQRARHIVDRMYGGSEYPGLQEAMEGLRRSFASAGSQYMAQDLSLGHIDLLRQELAEGAAGLPSFMMSAAWPDRSLYAFMGAWTSWRGTGAPDTFPEGTDAGEAKGGAAAGGLAGYVEPDLPALSRLYSLADMTLRGLRERGLLGAELDGRFQTLCGLLLAMQGAAEKELADQPFTPEEEAAFRDLSSTLDKLGAGLLEPVVVEQWEDREEDVSTQAAVGRPALYHVLVFYGGRYHCAVGAGFSYYELRRTPEAQLDRKAWRDMLEEGTAPLPPAWADGFLAQ